MRNSAYTDLLAFANTAAGKFVSVLVAVVMVLSLSSIALAVDGAVQDFSAANAGVSDVTANGEGLDGEGVDGEGLDGEGLDDAENADDAGGLEGIDAEGTDEDLEGTPGTGEGEGLANDGTSNEGDDSTPAPVEDVTEPVDEPLAGEDATVDPTDATDPLPTDDVLEAVAAEAVQDNSELHVQSSPTDDEIILGAITMPAKKLAAKAPGVRVDEARISVNAENCTVKVVDQALRASGTVDVPTKTDLIITVEPDEGYTLSSSSVTGKWGPPAMPPFTPLYRGENTYEIPADYVDSTLTLFASAVLIDPNNPVEPPVIDVIEEDTEIVPDGFYDAPVITVPDLTFTYFGVPQPVDAMSVMAEVEGLQPGDELVLTAFDGEAPINATNGKPATITFTDYAIFRNGELFTDKYQPAVFAKATVNVTIEKAVLTVFTPSATKVYDGKPLTYAGSFDTGDIAEVGILWNEPAPDENEFKVTGSQTAVGSSLNTYKLSSDFLKRIRDNYVLEEDLGTLTVTPAEGPALLAPSKSKIYDGKSLRAGDVIPIDLPKGYTATASVLGGPIKNVGKVRTYIEPRSIRILDAKGKDVTESFGGIELIDGELEITPRPLYVTTESASKTDDGTPLEAGGRMDGLLKGETASFATTGMQGYPGSSTNTYLITWDGNARERNYRIVEDLGTLTVREAAAGTVAASTGGTTYVEYVDTTPATTTTATSTTTSTDASSGFTPTRNTRLPDPSEVEGAPRTSSINPAVESIATGMQNLEQTLRGEEPTELIAPVVEETLADNETPLGVFDEPIDCWVHWYALLGLIATAIYGAVVMFFRRAYAHELESREADVLGVPVGLAQPRVPASRGSGSQAGREA